MIQPGHRHVSNKTKAHRRCLDSEIGSQLKNEQLVTAEAELWRVQQTVVYILTCDRLQENTFVWREKKLSKPFTHQLSVWQLQTSARILLSSILGTTSLLFACTSFSCGRLCNEDRDQMRSDGKSRAGGRGQINPHICRGTMWEETRHQLAAHTKNHGTFLPSYYL